MSYTIFVVIIFTISGKNYLEVRIDFIFGKIFLVLIWELKQPLKKVSVSFDSSLLLLSQLLV